MKKTLIFSVILILVFIVSVCIGSLVSSIFNKANTKIGEEIILAEEEQVTITASKPEEVVSPPSEEEIIDNAETYVLKEYEGRIAVYRIDENNQLILEEVTDILTKYLPEEDLAELNKGIKVEGIDELTHLIEDFE